MMSFGRRFQLHDGCAWFGASCGSGRRKLNSWMRSVRVEDLLCRAIPESHFRDFHDVLESTADGRFKIVVLVS